MSKQSTFRDLKASFETRSKPTTATAPSTTYRTAAGDLASMSTRPSNRSNRVPSLAKSIDSVLDTPPASSSPLRPLAKLRPSWIGPLPQERPTTPGVQAMKQAVTVEYTSPGLQPPVYIFTSLSEPQWMEIEMHREVDGHGGNVFSKTFHVEEGEYQYKFRLGEGDWWVCDESKATVDDGDGNKNNLLLVKAQSFFAKTERSVSEPKQASSSLSKTEQPKNEESDHPTTPPKIGLLEAEPVHDHPTTPAKTEQPKAEPAHNSSPPKEVQPTPKPKGQEVCHVHCPSNTPSPQKEVHGPAPPLTSETLKPHNHEKPRKMVELDDHDPAASQVEEAYTRPLKLPKADETSSTGATRGGDSDAGDKDDDSASSYSQSDGERDNHDALAPLLRHESLGPSSAEQDSHAPLFRHESIGIGHNHHHTHDPAAPHSTPHKSSKHAERHTPGDGFWREDAHHHSPASDALSDASISPRSPGSRRDSRDLALEKIREAEEEEFEKEEADGDEVDPLKPPEPEDADFEPNVHCIEKHIVVEVVERRRSVVESVLDKIGGRGNAFAVAIGLLVIAAGVASMQFL